MHLRDRLIRSGQQRMDELSRRGMVSVHHPDYDAPGALLFCFPATDGDPQTPGVHRDTIHTACAIIANNRFDGYISTSRDRHAARVDADILSAGDYYFHVPRPLDAVALTPYPIFPNFRMWRYPHGEHIPGWGDLRTGFMEHSYMDTCHLTDSKEAVQVAHIIPKAERQWFALNGMSSCSKQDRNAGANAIDQACNGISLRADIHKSWDMYRLMFVPKVRNNETEPSLVAHVSVESAELFELYHNVRLHDLGGICKEYLLARFAYDVFRQLRQFLQAGRDRWLVMQEDDGSVKTSRYTGPECARLAENQGQGRSSRSPTKDSSKSPKRKRDIEHEVADDQSPADTSQRKRQRYSLDSFDSAVGRSVDWAEVDSEESADEFRKCRWWIDPKADPWKGWYGDEEDEEAEPVHRGRRRWREGCR